MARLKLSMPPVPFQKGFKKTSQAKSVPGLGVVTCICLPGWKFYTSEESPISKKVITEAFSESKACQKHMSLRPLIQVLR